VSTPKQELIKLLQRCTVRVLSGKSGTGFFVAPGQILTCAHVLNATSARKQTIEFTYLGNEFTGVLEAIRPDPCPEEDREIFPDIALISTDLKTTPCVLLQHEFESETEMYSFGYTEEASGGESLACHCEGEKNYDLREDRKMIKLKAGQTIAGMSGAPLLNLKTGGVCGILRSTRDESSDLGGIAIRIERAAKVFPHIAKANLKFHQNNAEWGARFDAYMNDTRREVDRSYRQDKRQDEAMIQNTAPEVLVPTIRVWDPDWLPGSVPSPELQGNGSPQELKTGCRVVATFKGEPSRTWQDPEITSVAILNDEKSAARPLPADLWKKSRRAGAMVGESDRWDAPPLCIPTYDAPVEWRLESYVYEPPWGPAKRRVVESFLARCSGKQVECVVVSNRSSGQARWKLALQSSDYDIFLQMQWPYYKGLESAMSRGRYFKSDAILALSNEALKQFVEGEMLADPKFPGLIPSRFRQQFEEREIEKEDVYLMLKGIIERERAAIHRLNLRRGIQPARERDVRRARV
jgi:Trypsin-like peptidase domain